MTDEISLLTHAEWCKCIDTKGPYGGELLRRLEGDPRAADPILMTWDQFERRINEALHP